MMPWRMLVYLTQIWSRYIAAHRGVVTKLPFIIPIVLAQCKDGWTAPTQLSELFDLPEDVREIFGTPVELRFLVDEMTGSVLNDQEARDDVLALVELTRALLVGFQRPELLDETRIAELAPLFDIVRRMKPVGHEDLQSLWTYVISTFGPQSPIHAMLLKVVSQESRDVYATIKDEWRADGLAEGRADGLTEGRAAGKAEMILRLLECRELPVPASLRERVVATKDELQLQRWFERAVSARSIDEIFERHAR